MAARSDQLVESDSLVDLVVPIDASDDPIVGGGATAGAPFDDEFQAAAGSDDDGDQFDDPDPDPPPPAEVEGTSSLVGAVLSSVSRRLNPAGWFG